MALAQPVLRLGGPSWDEEVVPALRKRLESESRTLSRRMSAISLSADDGPMPISALVSESTARQTTQVPSHVRRGSSTRTPRASTLPMENSHSSSSGSTSRTNPNTAKAQSSVQRSRTYSQPDVGNTVNSSAKGTRNTRTADGGKSNDSVRSRPSEPKPTRIPKPSRGYGGNSNGNTPVVAQTNGFQTYGHNVSETYEERPSQFTSSTTRSTVGLPNNRSTSGLLNEPAPFPASSSATSLAYSQNGHAETQELSSRPSTDSEERPFEHWYRGEISRNGGVGELRVGRKQEMLEIANYGHMIRGMQGKTSPGWSGYQSPLHHQPSDSRRHRKRADSIGGLTDIERVRGSILFDEESMNAVGRVLDEHPLTDLEGEESDVASLASRHYRRDYNYIPGVGDISISTVTPTATTPTMSDEAAMGDRSTTPQPNTYRNGQYPPSRIPSRAPRRSSESRAATPTMNSTAAMNVSTSTSSKTPSPPPGNSTTHSVSSQSVSTAPNGKRVVSPTSAKKRTPVKSLRGKQTPPAFAKKEEPRSISQYPSPGGDEDMADAIPTWTQPVPKTGNWDEVVLPVVARQKGLDDMYQTADGSPQPKRVETTIAPAPGTFGYDATKYRRNRDLNEAIPMDEFGRPPEREPRIQEVQNTDEFRPYEEAYWEHDKTRLPIQGHRPAPSPVPFSQDAPPRAPMSVSTQYPPVDHDQPPLPTNDPIPDLDDKGAGCCKCNIM